MQAQNTGPVPIDVQVILHTAGSPVRAVFPSVTKSVPPLSGPANLEFLYATDFPGLGDLTAVSAVELLITSQIPGGTLLTDSLTPSMGSVPVELLSFTVEQ